MSVFGDDRPHMNDWIEQLEQRAEDVGARQAVKEFADVLSTFAEYYWPEQPNA
jgi:hypothetical protein